MNDTEGQNDMPVGHADDHGASQYRSDTSGERGALSRRALLAGVAGGAVASSIVWAGATAFVNRRMARAPLNAGSPAPGSRDRLLLQGGLVLSMDAAVGDFEEADVLIEGTTIAEVGPRLRVDAPQVDCAGMLVIPGFVNSHVHMFQTALRAYWADALAADYFSQSREDVNAIFHKYQPDDVYHGEYVGALECLNAGVTTAVDTSQCSYTPAHSDAAIRGLADSGMRAVYAYSPTSGGNVADPQYAYPQDLTRIQQEMSTGGGDLVTLALGGPLNADNWSLARSHGVPIFTHVNNAAAGHDLEALGKGGLMGTDNTYIHCNTLDPSTWTTIAATGGRVSLSTLVEQTLGSGLPGIRTALDHGMLPGLSTDAVTLGPADFFSQMRSAYALQRSRILEHRASGRTDLARVVSCREILEMATMGGAHAAHLGDTVGSLTPGKQADVVLLDAKTLNAAPLSSAAGAIVTLMDTSNVDSVLVAGRMVKRGGQLIGVDVQDALRQLQQSADGLFARSKYPRDALGSCCQHL